MVDKRKDSLPAAVKDEFKALLLGISDTKLLLGYHFGEWTFRTPTLEAGIATCNFAQDELGHVRLLHGLLKNYSGENDATLIHDRPPEKYNAVVSLNIDISSWIELISLSAVIDSGLTLLLESMSDSSFRPLRERVEKILQEEKFHSDYTHAWVVSLAADGNGSADMVGEVFRKAVPAYTSWLCDLTDSALVEEGILNMPIKETLAKTFENVNSLAQHSGLNLPNSKEMELEESKEYPRYPDEAIIYSLRGEKNEVFRV